MTLFSTSSNDSCFQTTTKTLALGDIAIHEHSQSSDDQASRTSHFAPVASPHVERLIAESSYSIDDYLRKPFNIWSGSWSVVSGLSPVIIDLPDDIIHSINTAQILPLQMLIQRFKNIRFHAQFYLQISSMQFYQGKLILSWFPGRFRQTTSAGYLWNAGMAINCSHVQLDASENKSAMLDTNWVLPSTHYKTIDNAPNNDTLRNFQNQIGQIIIM
jgi:hypothetical protein